MGELTDQLRSFLAERRYAVLATHGCPDGGIRLAPIWYLFEDDRFHFATPSGSRKVRNVERNVSASVVVNTREPGRERWVSASGPVEILREGEAHLDQWPHLAQVPHGEALDGPIGRRLPRVGRCHAAPDADDLAVVDRADRGLPRADEPSSAAALAGTTRPSRTPGHDSEVSSATLAP